MNHECMPSIAIAIAIGRIIHLLNKVLQYYIAIVQYI
jgi:hypothetical protein